MYKSFHKKTGLQASVNEELAEEFHKPVIKNFKRRKVYARFRNNIRAADLAEMESFPYENQVVKYLLCVLDFFTKNAQVTLLKVKKLKQLLMVLLKL